MAVDLEELVPIHFRRNNVDSLSMAYLTEDQITEILRRWDAGEIQRTIALTVGCSKHSVRNVARKHGRAPRAGWNGGNSWKRLSHEEESEILRLWDEGVPLSYVASRMDLTKGRVERVLNEHGLHAVARGRAKREYASNYKG